MAIIADQWLIDRLVDSAYRGEQYTVDYDVLFDHDQDFSGQGAIEPLVALSIDRLLNYWDLDLNDESLWDYVGHDGLKETLGHDDVLNDEARLAFITWRLHGQLEDPDYDLVPSVYAYEIEDSQGRKALVVYLSTGYSFTGNSRSVIGAFPDEASIRQYLREDGYVVDEEGLYAEIGERKESLLDKWDYSYEPVIEQAEQVSRNRIFDDYDLQLIDSSDLWKRGWTRSMVRRFLPNSWGKRSGKNTYLLESIDNVENTLEFQDTLEKSLKRRQVDDDVLTAIKKERTRTRRMMKAYQKSQMQKVRTMFSRVMLRRYESSGPSRPLKFERDRIDRKKPDAPAKIKKGKRPTDK